MLKKVKFIYNPSSGETLITEHLDEIVSMYQQAGYSMSLHRLDFKTADEDVLGDVDNSFDHLLIAGGDGTVNYIVNLMAKQGIDIPVGLIPSGTANDFATLIGMPRDLTKACRKILDGTPKPMDLGCVNGMRFVNIFSCGLFTDVSQRTSTVLKNTFGKLAYYVEGIGELPRFRTMNLKLSSDGGDYEGSSLIFFVFNGRTAGNFPIAYNARPDDGLLDVLIVKGNNPLRAAQTVIHFINNLPRKRYPKSIIHLQCSRLDVLSEHNEKTDTDGQPGPDFPLHIECLHEVLKVRL